MKNVLYIKWLRFASFMTIVMLTLLCILSLFSVQNFFKIQDNLYAIEQSHLEAGILSIPEDDIKHQHDEFIAPSAIIKKKVKRRL